MFVHAPCDSPLSLASAFTWEVKANNRAYNNQFKEKSFLCWQRKKYKVGKPRPTALAFLLSPSLPCPPILIMNLGAGVPVSLAPLQSS